MSLPLAARTWQVYPHEENVSITSGRIERRDVQFLKDENRDLRGRLPKRLIVTPQERQRLLKYGQPLGLAVRELITIFSYPRIFAGYERPLRVTRTKRKPSLSADRRSLSLRRSKFCAARQIVWHPRDCRTRKWLCSQVIRLPKP